jgi:DNA-binding NtrC family response regulator
MNSPTPPGLEGIAIIVDDEHDALEEYREFLELSGIQCIVEADPEKALARILDDADIKVLVTDLRMPRLNGADLISRLQASLHPDRELSYLIVSGYGDSDLTRDIPEVRILTKPVDLTRLTEFLRESLRAR